MKQTIRKRDAAVSRLYHARFSWSDDRICDASERAPPVEDSGAGEFPRMLLARRIVTAAPEEYTTTVRRVSAALLLAFFGFSLITPELSASDPESKLPLCCRRTGKHHCAMTESDSSSGPAVQALSPTYPTAAAVPVNSVVSLSAISLAAFVIPVTRPAIRPHTQSLCHGSFSRTRQKRGPPILLS